MKFLMKFYRMAGYKLLQNKLHIYNSGTNQSACEWP